MAAPVEDPTDLKALKDAFSRWSYSFQSDPLPILKEVAELFEEISEPTDPRFDPFMKHLTKSLHSLLHRSFSKPIWSELDVEQVCDFLKLATKFCTAFVLYSPTTVKDCFELLFASEQNLKFYQTHKKLSDLSSLKFTNQEWVVSDHMLANVNVFITMSGPERILERIADEEDKINLTTLATYVTIFFRIYDLLISDLAKKYVKSLWTLSKKLILGMTPAELKNEKKSTLSQIVENLSKMLTRIYPEGKKPNQDSILEQKKPKAEILSQKFQLEIALQWLRLPFIQKRVQGLTDINEFCQMKFQDPPKGLSPLDLCEWIKKEKIVEYLFSEESTHWELTKRAGAMLRFLADNHFISNSDLDLFWSAATGKHETIMHQMWELMGNLSLYLSLEQVQYLFDKIKTVPAATCDLQFIEFIRKVSESGIYIESRDAPEPKNPKNFFGLSLLWDHLHTTTEYNIVVALHRAFSYLIGLRGCSQAREDYTSLCLSNLRDLRSVPKSLQILQAILAKEKGLENLDSLKDIVDLFLSSLQNYSDLAVSKASSLEPGTDINKHVFHETDEYFARTKICLDFFHEIFSHLDANAELTEPQIDSFWDATITKALTPQVSDEAFAWMENALASHGRIISDNGLFYIFNHKIPSLKFSTLTHAGFKMFEFYFRFINWKVKKLQLIPNNNGEYYLTDSALEGYDILWKITIEAEDDHVGNNATDLLNRIQTSFHGNLKGQFESFRESYVSRCITSLKECAKEYYEAIESQQHIYEKRINRILTALGKYMQIEKSNPALNHGVSSRATPIVITVVPLNGTKLTFRNLTDKNTIGELRQHVAEHLEVHPLTVRLISAGKEFSDDKAVLCDLKSAIQGNWHFHAIKKNLPPKPLPEIPVDIVDIPTPSQILAQDKYFEEAFNLLNLPAPMCHLVWELLMKSPTNASMKLKLKELQADTDWNSILDTSNIFRLYYSLQIVDSMMYSTSNQEPAEEEKAPWLSSFVQFGGLRHLVNILLTADFFHSQSTKRLVCLGLLLENLNFALTKIDQNDTLVLKKELFDSLAFDPVVVTDKLMHVLQNVSLPEKNMGLSISASMEDELSPTKSQPLDNETVARHAMRLLSSLLLAEDSALAHFFTKPLGEWIQAVILASPLPALRKATADGIMKVCVREEERNKILQVLDGFLPSLCEPKSRLFVHTSFQYFDLLASLIQGKHIGSPEPIESVTLFMKKIVAMIHSRQIIEQTSSSPEDQTMMGLTHLALTLVRLYPPFKETIGPELLSDIFHKNLFDTPTTEHVDTLPPRCKTPTCRNYAFRLMLELSYGCDANLHALCVKTLQLHASQKLQTDWEYQPERYDKAGSGYVGLENLGTTCYMNSLIQQLFMQPHFRHGLLSVVDSETDKEKSALYQLQSIFVTLQESAMKSHNPHSFCQVFQIDGGPMRCDQQMDVDEFFNVLFDRLEGFLKGTPQATMLNDLYGGEIVNQIISSECPHTAERIEPFLNLKVEVKSKFTLYQSLDLFVQGDKLEGQNKYHCGECNEKVIALKRCCINKLPRNLIVHLKRFDYDLELLRRNKINQLCEFPQTLNMEPYTKEGLEKREGKKPTSELPPECYEYELKGVLVHAGTTESGHYYSFIKDRDTSKWFQFNDRHVTPFHQSQIRNECFGGQYQPPTDAKPHPQRMWKHNSAYLLFYEQSHPLTPLPKILPEQKHKDLPPELYSKVWDDNFKFLMDKNLFDKDCISFLEKIVEMIEERIATNTIEKATIATASKLAITFYVQTLSHAHDKSCLPHVSNLLKNIMKYHVPSAQWFLEQLTSPGNKWIKSMLTRCYIRPVSFEFCQLVAHAVAIYAPHDLQLEQSLEEQENQSTEVVIDPTKPLSPIVSLIVYLLETSKKITKRWREFVHFWQLFEELANISSPIRQLMISLGVISKLAHLYLQHDSPWFSGPKPKKERSENEKNALANMKGAVGAISRLICACRLDSVQSESEEETEEEEPLLFLPPKERKLLASEVLFRFISDKTYPEAIIQLLKHMHYENAPNSDFLLSTMRRFHPNLMTTKPEDVSDTEA